MLVKTFFVETTTIAAASKIFEQSDHDHDEFSEVEH
jgi:hypothetical protein